MTISEVNFKHSGLLRLRSYNTEPLRYVLKITVIPGEKGPSACAEISKAIKAVWSGKVEDGKNYSFCKSKLAEFRY